jgi:replicative DNA helicase
MIPPNIPIGSDEARLPPANLETERLVLGSALISPDHLNTVAAISGDLFSREDHRRIHARLMEMSERGEKVDYVTLANELRKFGQLESVGGVSAVVGLKEGLPDLPAINSYIRTLGDFAGRRKIIALAQVLADRAYRGEQSPTEILTGASGTWNEIETDSETGDGGRTPEQVIETYPGGISAFLDATLRVQGLPTGFTKFDEMTGGMLGGQVLIIAARPAHGKTALALNVAQYLTLHPKQRRFVAFFSLEMSAASLLTRAACSHGRIDQHKFRLGYLNKDERHRLQVALHEITESHIRFYDRSGISMPEIATIIRRLVKEEGLHLAIIDYLQLVGSHGKIENRNQEVSVMSRQLKMLAMETDIPIVMLSQLSRQTDRRGDPRPVLSDLRDSGSLEQDADVVAFVFREEMHKRDREDLRGVAELIIQKQRNGPIGNVPLIFLGQFTRFENRADDLLEPE